MKFTLPTKNIRDVSVRADLVAIEQHLSNPQASVRLTGSCRLYFDESTKKLYAQYKDETPVQISAL